MNKTRIFSIFFALMLLTPMFSGAVMAQESGSEVTPETVTADDLTVDDVVALTQYHPSQMTQAERNATMDWIGGNAFSDEVENLSQEENQQMTEWQETTLAYQTADDPEQTTWEERPETPVYMDSSESSESSESSSSDSSEQSSQGTPEFVFTEQVEVTEPSYVSGGVNYRTEEGRDTYKTQGGEIHFYFSDEVTVQEAGVQEDAQLQYDSRSDSYVLNLSKDGTYTLDFSLEFNGESYQHTIYVDATETNYQHVTQSTYNSLQDKSDAYDQINREWSEYTADESTESTVELLTGDALTWYKFYKAPLEVFGERFFSITILLIRWPTGWVILGSIAIATMLFRYRDRKDAQQARRQMASFGDIELEKLEAEARRLRKMLSEKDFQQLGFNDSDSRFFREHLGPNPKSAVDTLLEYLDPEEIIRAYLEVYSEQGHQIIENENGDYEITQYDHGDDGMDPADVSGEVLDELDWGEIDSKIIHESNNVELPLNTATQDLADDMNISLREDGDTYAYIENRSELSKLLAQLLVKISTLDEFDEEGRLREEYDLLNILWMFTAESSEKYRFPVWNLRELLLKTQEELDSEQSLQSDIESLEDYGDLR